MAHVARTPLGPASPVERILRPFLRFIHAETSGGIVLLVATVGALIWANSTWASSYHHLWELPVGLRFGAWDLSMTLHHFINDGLMAVFFLFVGLEIKREMLVGELASFRAAALPIAAAAGGMLIPAALYTALNLGGPGASGWGIPMATDIAFALGILALMGPRVPLGLKVFLAALAIVDDLGAVLVIAIFYTADLDVGALGTAAGVFFALLAMNRLGVRHAAAYGLVGLFLWFAVLASGVHATVAGVLLALAIPARTRIDTHEFLVTGREILDEFDHAGVEGGDVLTNQGQQEAILALENSCEAAQAPLRRLEHNLHHWIAFLIIPVFALANAGVELSGGLGESVRHPVPLGIILGLVLGKPIGISLFSWVAVRTGLVVLPQRVTWRALVGVSFLGGIGFTMSLFIATLAFGEASPLLDLAKIGILAASILAAVVGWILLRSGQPEGAVPSEA
ncbi:MAG: Na+/H+ antiporter NhaA [Gemmatimonadetes bacterium]|nr:Na+/H+ antiporter NhaA [Gemmatimonadota bacterium]